MFIFVRSNQKRATFQLSLTIYHVIIEVRSKSLDSFFHREIFLVFVFWPLMICLRNYSWTSICLDAFTERWFQDNAICYIETIQIVSLHINRKVLIDSLCLLDLFFLSIFAKFCDIACKNTFLSDSWLGL